MDKKQKDLLKLSKLLEHWSDHNNSHKESYLTWRDIAKNYGLESIVEKLDKVIELTDKCSENLLAAHEELD